MRGAGSRVIVWVGIGAVLVVGLFAAIGTAGVAAATPPLTFGQVAANQTTKFSGGGFEANEPLAFWVTAPDRSVTPLVGEQADTTGAFSVTVSFSSDGFWQVTARGANTKREIIGGFTVGNAAPSVAPGTVGANATAVVPNQSVTFVREGFRPLEQVSLWVTAPDAKVTPLDGTAADVSGTVNLPVSFASSGYWQVTAHGLTTGYEVIVAYSVGDAITMTGTGTAVPTYTIGDPVLPGTRTATPFSGTQSFTIPTPVPTVTPAAATSNIGGSEARPTGRAVIGATPVR